MALLDEGGAQKNSPPTINPFKKYETPGRRNWWNQLIEKNSFRSKFTKQLDETKKMTIPSIWETIQDQRKKAEAAFKLAAEAKAKQQALLDAPKRPMPGIEDQPADEKDKNPFSPHVLERKPAIVHERIADPFSSLNPNINNIFKIPEVFREEAWAKMILKTPLPKTTQRYLIGFMGGEQDGSSLTPETKKVLDRLKVGDNTAWYDLTKNTKIRDELLKAGTPATLDSFFDETRNKLLDEATLRGANRNGAQYVIEEAIRKIKEENIASIMKEGGVGEDQANRMLIYGLTYQTTFEEVINEWNSTYAAMPPIPVWVLSSPDLPGERLPQMILNPNLRPEMIDKINKRMLDQFGEKWIEDTFKQPSEALFKRIGKKLLKYVPEGETGYKLATGQGITVGDILRGLPMGGPVVRGYEETSNLVNAVRQSGGDPREIAKSLIGKQIGDTFTSSIVPEGPITDILTETKLGRDIYASTTPAGALGNVGKLFEADIFPSRDENGKLIYISYNEVHEAEMARISRPIQEFIKPAYQPFVEPTAEVSEHTIDLMFNAAGIDTDLAHSIRNGLIDDIVAEMISPTSVAMAIPTAGTSYAAIRAGVAIGSKKAILAGVNRLMFELFMTGLEPGLFSKAMRGLNEIALTGTAAWARLGPDLKQSKAFNKLANSLIETTQTEAGQLYVTTINQTANKSRAARLMLYNEQRNVIQTRLPEHLSEEVQLVETDIEAALQVTGKDAQARNLLITEFNTEIYRHKRIPQLKKFNLDNTILTQDHIERAYNDLYNTFGKQFVDNYRLGHASAEDLAKISEFIRNPVRPRASVLKELVSDYNNQLDAEIIKLSENRGNLEAFYRGEGFIPEREMYQEATGLSPVLARPIGKAKALDDAQSIENINKLHSLGLISDTEKAVVDAGGRLPTKRYYINIDISGDNKNIVVEATSELEAISKIALKWAKLPEDDLSRVVIKKFQGDSWNIEPNTVVVSFNEANSLEKVFRTKPINSGNTIEFITNKTTSRPIRSSGSILIDSGKGAINLTPEQVQERFVQMLGHQKTISGDTLIFTDGKITNNLDMVTKKLFDASEDQSLRNINEIAYNANAVYMTVNTNTSMLMDIYIPTNISNEQIKIIKDRSFSSRILLTTRKLKDTGFGGLNVETEVLEEQIKLLQDYEKALDESTKSIDEFYELIDEYDALSDPRIRNVIKEDIRQRLLLYDETQGIKYSLLNNLRKSIVIDDPISQNAFYKLLTGKDAPFMKFYRDEIGLTYKEVGKILDLSTDEVKFIDELPELKQALKDLYGLDKLPGYRSEEGLRKFLSETKDHSKIAKFIDELDNFMNIEESARLDNAILAGELGPSIVNDINNSIDVQRVRRIFNRGKTVFTRTGSAVDINFLIDWAGLNTEQDINKYLFDLKLATMSTPFNEMVTYGAFNASMFRELIIFDSFNIVDKNNTTLFKFSRNQQFLGQEFIARSQRMIDDKLIIPRIEGVEDTRFERDLDRYGVLPGGSNTSVPASAEHTAFVKDIKALTNELLDIDHSFSLDESVNLLTEHIIEKYPNIVSIVIENLPDSLEGLIVQKAKTLLKARTRDFVETFVKKEVFKFTEGPSRFAKELTDDFVYVYDPIGSRIFLDGVEMSQNDPRWFHISNTSMAETIRNDTIKLLEEDLASPLAITTKEQFDELGFIGRTKAYSGPEQRAIEAYKSSVYQEINQSLRHGEITEGDIVTKAGEFSGVEQGWSIKENTTDELGGYVYQLINNGEGTSYYVIYNPLNDDELIVKNFNTGDHIGEPFKLVPENKDLAGLKISKALKAQIEGPMIAKIVKDNNIFNTKYLGIHDAPLINDFNNLTHIVNLDTAITKQTLKHPITVYRGLGAEIFSKTNVGDIVFDPAFTSTTLKREVAARWDLEVHGGLSSENKALLEIELPAGTETVPTTTWGFGSGEAEFILPRNMSLEITSIEPIIVSHRSGEQKLLLHVKAEVYPTPATGRQLDPDLMDLSDEEYQFAMRTTGKEAIEKLPQGYEDLMSSTSENNFEDIYTILENEGYSTKNARGFVDKIASAQTEEERIKLLQQLTQSEDVEKLRALTTSFLKNRKDVVNNGNTIILFKKDESNVIYTKTPTDIKSEIHKVSIEDIIAAPGMGHNLDNVNGEYIVLPKNETVPNIKEAARYGKYYSYPGTSTVLRGMTGFSLGYASGDTPEERLRNALLGSALGVFGPAAVRGGRLATELATHRASFMKQLDLIAYDTKMAGVLPNELIFSPTKIIKWQGDDIKVNFFRAGDNVEIAGAEAVVHRADHIMSININEYDNMSEDYIGLVLGHELAHVYETFIVRTFIEKGLIKRGATYDESIKNLAQYFAVERNIQLPPVEIPGKDISEYDLFGELIRQDVAANRVIDTRMAAEHIGDVVGAVLSGDTKDIPEDIITIITKNLQKKPGKDIVRRQFQARGGIISQADFDRKYKYLIEESGFGYRRPTVTKTPTVPGVTRQQVEEFSSILINKTPVEDIKSTHSDVLNAELPTNYDIQLEGRLRNAWTEEITVNFGSPTHIDPRYESSIKDEGLTLDDLKLRLSIYRDEGIIRINELMQTTYKDMFAIDIGGYATGLENIKKLLGFVEDFRSLNPEAVISGHLMNRKLGELLTKLGFEEIPTHDIWPIFVLKPKVKIGLSSTPRELTEYSARLIGENLGDSSTRGLGEFSARSSGKSKPQNINEEDMVSLRNFEEQSSLTKEGEQFLIDVAGSAGARSRKPYKLTYISDDMKDIAKANGFEVTAEMEKSPTRFEDFVAELTEIKRVKEIGSQSGIVEKITGNKVFLKLDNGVKFETTVGNVEKLPQVKLNIRTEEKIIETFGASFEFSENMGSSTVMLTDGRFAVIDDISELGQIIDKTNVTEQDITKLINSTQLTKITKLNDGVEISMSGILNPQQRQAVINLAIDNKIVMRMTDAKTGLEIDGPFNFFGNKVDRNSEIGGTLRAVANKPYKQWGGTREGLPHILDTEEYTVREQKIEKLLLAISQEENPSNITLLKKELANLEQERTLVETYVLKMTRNGELGTGKKIAIAKQSLREQLKVAKEQNKIKAIRMEINALEEAARTSEKSIPRTAEEVQQDIAYKRGVKEFITGTTTRYIKPKKGDADLIGEALDRLAGIPYKPISLSFNFEFASLEHADNAIANAQQVVLWQRERRNYIKRLVEMGDITSESSQLADAEKGLKEAIEALQNANRTKVETEAFLLRQNFTNNILNNMPEGADPVRIKYVTNMLKRAYDNVLSILTIDKNVTDGNVSAIRKFALMAEENIAGNLYGPVSQVVEMSRILFDTLRTNTHSIIDPISKRVAKEIEEGLKTGTLILSKDGRKAIEKLTPEQLRIFFEHEAKHIIQHPEHYEGMSRDLLESLKELQIYQLEHLNIARGLNYPIEAMEAPYLEQLWDVPAHFLAPTGAPRIPGRVSIAHDRVFGDYLEGIKAGFTPKEYSVDAVIRHSAALVDKAIADSFERSVVLEKLGGRKLLPGERGVVGRGFKEFETPLYRGWVAPELIVKQLDALHVVSRQGKVITKGTQFINRFKNTMFGPGDFGVIGVQVLKALAYGGPTLFWGMINNTLAAFDSPWYLKLYMEDQDIMAHSVAAALDGVHQGIGPSSITVGEGTLLQYVPVIGTTIDAPISNWVDRWAKIQFGWTLTPIRNMLYESNLFALKLAGEDIMNPLIRRKAADNANALTGASRGAIKGGRRQLEGSLFISSQMFRSEIATLGQIAKIAWPVGVSGVSKADRILALTTLASFGLMVYGLGGAIAKFTGNDMPGYDPRNGDWATITFKQLRDNKGNPLKLPLIPSRGLIRAIGKSVLALGGTDEMFNAVYEGDMDAVLAEIRAMSPDELSQIWLQYVGSKGSPALMAIPNLGAGIGYYDGAFRLGGVPLEGRIRGSMPLPLLAKQVELPFGRNIDRYLSEEDFKLISAPTAFGALGFSLFPLSAFKQRDESVTNWAIENNIRNAEGQLVTKYNDLDKFQQTTYGETDIGANANFKVDEARDKINDKYNQLNTAWEKEKIIKTAMIASAALEIQPNIPGGAQPYKDEVKDINASFSRTYDNLATGFGVSLNEQREPRSKDEELWYKLIDLDPGSDAFIKPASFTKTGDIIPTSIDWDRYNAERELIISQMSAEAQKQVREGKFNSLDERANEAAKRKDIAGRQLEQMLNVPKYKGLTKEEGDSVDHLIESVR